jgi:hypothetical protein
VKVKIKNKKISTSSLFLGDAKSPSIGLKDTLHWPIKETTKDRGGKLELFVALQKTASSSICFENVVKLYSHLLAMKKE